MKGNSLINTDSVKTKPSCLSSWLYAPELAVLFVFFFLKVIFFYQYIKIGSVSIWFTFFTCAVTLLIAFAGVFLFRISPFTAYFTVYTAMCFVMTVDRLYFAYFRKLPGLKLLQFASQLGAVEGTVNSVIGFSHIIYMLDIPLIIIYIVNLRGKLLERTRLSEKKRSSFFRTTAVSSLILSAAMLLTLPIAGAAGTLKASYLGSELIVYHGTDFINLFDDGKTEVDFDPLELIGTDRDGSVFKGIARGRNLIVIQVESMQELVVGSSVNGQEITPCLNELIGSDTLYFDNYYYLVGGGNTSDAEFAFNNSLYAPEGLSAYTEYTENDYNGLPFILKQNGYTGAYVFHGYVKDFWNREAAYPYQGFDYYYSADDYVADEIIDMGVSDMSFFRQTAEKLTTLEQPFYAFTITLSSHNPFVIPDELNTLVLPTEYEDTMFGNYLEAMHYTDSAIGYFIGLLKENGIYDNSIIVIYGDHFGVVNNGEEYDLISDFVGHGYYEGDIFRIPFIIHIPGMGASETISVAGSHIDALPTLLDLFGITNDRSVMFGQNLLTAKSGIVYEQMHVPIGSFITDSIFYVYPASGILSNAVAFDLSTGNVTDPGDVDDIVDAAIKAHQRCKALLDNNAVIIK